MKLVQLFELTLSQALPPQDNPYLLSRSQQFQIGANQAAQESQRKIMSELNRTNPKAHSLRHR